MKAMSVTTAIISIMLFPRRNPTIKNTTTESPVSPTAMCAATWLSFLTGKESISRTAPIATEINDVGLPEII